MYDSNPLQHDSLPHIPLVTKSVSSFVATRLKPDNLGDLKKLLLPVANYWVEIADQLGMTSQVHNIRASQTMSLQQNSWGTYLTGGFPGNILYPLSTLSVKLWEKILVSLEEMEWPRVWKQNFKAKEVCEVTYYTLLASFIKTSSLVSNNYKRNKSWTWKKPGDKI